MEHGLARVLTGVEYGAVAFFFQSQFCGDLLRRFEQLLEHRAVRGCRVTDARDMYFGHHQHMHGCLRADVAEGQSSFCLQNLLAGQRPIDDSAKQTFSLTGIHFLVPLGPSIKDPTVVFANLPQSNFFRPRIKMQTSC